MAKYNIVFLFVLVLSVLYNVEAQIFDITRFGAMPGGAADSAPAVFAAWQAACASPTGGTVLVPTGVFLVQHVMLEGPCKAPILFQLQGTINAPTSLDLPDNIDWFVFSHVDHVTINGGGIFDGQGQQTWAKKMANQIPFNQPTTLGLSFVNHATVTDITIQNSKMFQSNVLGCLNVTFEKVTVTAPADSPNTDGIHIGRSTDVKVIDTTITTGDDCISIGDGAQQVNINGVRCGPGHGLAIGSLGKYPGELPVVGIFVKNCTLTNTDNGLRVKTWRKSPGPGIASDIHFDDITLTNVSNPIFVDQEYCPLANCPPSDPPSTVQISKLSFSGITGTSATKTIVKLVCSQTHPCAEVEFGNINVKYTGSGNNLMSSLAADNTEPPTVLTNVQPKLTGTQIPPIAFGANAAVAAGGPVPAGGPATTGPPAKP